MALNSKKITFLYYKVKSIIKISKHPTRIKKIKDNKFLIASTEKCMEPNSGNLSLLDSESKDLISLIEY